MLPRCETIAARWPIATSAAGVLRERTHSMKSRVCWAVASSTGRFLVLHADLRRVGWPRPRGQLGVDLEAEPVREQRPIGAVERLAVRSVVGAAGAVVALARGAPAGAVR